MILIFYLYFYIYKPKAAFFKAKEGARGEPPFLLSQRGSHLSRASETMVWHVNTGYNATNVLWDSTDFPFDYFCPSFNIITFL